jgi:hypothetical protein
VISIFISSYNALDHLLHYTEPTIQKFIVRIILIVPIYSVYSWYVPSGCSLTRTKHTRIKGSLCVSVRTRPTLIPPGKRCRYGVTILSSTIR